MPASRRLHRLVFATVVAAALLPGAAQAGMLASGLLLSTDAERLDCFLANVGEKPVSITGVRIQNGGATILSLSFNTCETLAPSGNCAFSADLDSRFSARAVVEFRGGAKALRGQCQLTSSANQLVATTELR